MRRAAVLSGFGGAASLLLGLTLPEILHDAPRWLILVLFGVGITLLVLTVLLTVQGWGQEESPVKAIETVEEKRRTREAFVREMSKPVESIFAILTLKGPRTLAQLEGCAGVVDIAPVREDQDGLYFGFRPGPEGWQSNGTVNGIISEAWTFPKSSNANTPHTVIDKIFLRQFSAVDRLEAGGRLPTSFDNVEDVTHAMVLLFATEPLIQQLSRITLVVNGFVMLDMDAREILKWSPHPPPFNVTPDFQAMDLLRAEMPKERRPSITHEMWAVMDANGPSRTVRLAGWLGHQAGYRPINLSDEDRGIFPLV